MGNTSVYTIKIYETSQFNGLSFYNESVKFSSLHIQRGALATIQ